MLVQNLLQPFEIEFIQADQCPIKPHHHTFFELVYIPSGKGKYCINDNSYHYQAESLFLLMPLDKHYTQVQATSEFLFIRFHPIYLKAQQSKDQYSNLGEWIPKLEYIFQHRNYVQGSLIHHLADKPLVRAIVQAMITEQQQPQPLHKELIQQLINTLIAIVARNISLHMAAKTHISQDTSLDMIAYIHINIYTPEKLKAEAIAAHFNISLYYIGEYFKKHTGTSLQQYIIQYKLALAEIRLQHSDRRLGEIAFELGFTDESHLSKIFKKYKGITPAQYRKKQAGFAK